MRSFEIKTIENYAKNLLISLIKVVILSNNKNAIDLAKKYNK